MSEETVSEVEQQAMADGWAPKEKWKGPEDQWISAEEFVERGKQLNPILRANNERLKRELEKKNQLHEQELNALRQSAEKFQNFVKEAAERKVQELEAQVQQLRVARAEAQGENDYQRVAKIEDAIDQTKVQVQQAKQDAAAPPLPPKAHETPIDPKLQAWMDSNPWYGDEKYMEESDIVTAIGASIRKTHPKISGEEWLEMLEERIDERGIRPSKQRKGPSPESGDRSSRANPRGGKTYSNLPAEAKTVCDELVSQKLLTREQYVADFAWE